MHSMREGCKVIGKPFETQEISNKTIHSVTNYKTYQIIKISTVKILNRPHNPEENKKSTAMWGTTSPKSP